MSGRGNNRGGGRGRGRGQEGHDNRSGGGKSPNSTDLIDERPRSTSVRDAVPEASSMNGRGNTNRCAGYAEPIQMHQRHRLSAQRRGREDISSVDDSLPSIPRFKAAEEEPVPMRGGGHSNKRKQPSIPRTDAVACSTSGRGTNYYSVLELADDEPSVESTSDTVRGRHDIGPED
jgi:hypothetical protein